ncbi:MAG TPA: hypothetical protein VM754_08850 [Actinomycetota bacterium]|nr:hypothetical protein [Actinomycetota bacterium]
MNATAEISTANLSAYLSDHMAGSSGGVELAQSVAEHNPGNEFFEQLLKDIKSDQDTLERLMDKVGASESSIKTAGAVAAQKIGSTISGSGGSGSTEKLGILREAEMLSLGITGKLSLWQVLEELAPSDERLAGFNLSGLVDRARKQLDGLHEQHRLLARKAFLR